MNGISPSIGASVALARLEAHGFEAYAVGGCVRDSLLGRTPNDWDVTTSALPDETAACFADCRVIETGMKHGTVAVLLENELIEITTYRLDGEYADNRHPVKVTFSKTLADDLSRRDFTVNAMAYHPKRGLVDLFGGIQDLKDRMIRCVGDPTTRFEEDGLRILRALRFASVLGFSIDPETAKAIHACRELLCNIAAERIREEFNKLICGRGAVSILREFSDVFAVFLPEIAPCFGFPQNTKYHCYDVWEHTLHALEYTTSPDLLTRLGIFLHDVGKPHSHQMDAEGSHFKGHAEAGVALADKLLHRLRYDNATRELLLKLIRYHDAPLRSEPKHVKRALLRYGERGLEAMLELHRCDRLAHAPAYSQPPRVLAEIPETLERLRAEDACMSLSKLTIKGSDLLAAGYPAGRRMGEILQALLDAVIDDLLPNEREALLAYAKQNFPIE